MSHVSCRRPARTLRALLALALLAACGGDEDEHEPDIATMRIIIGATAVDFAGSCTPSIPTVVIPAVGASVAASFLRADGSPDPAVTEDEFELKVEPASRFTRTSAFAGTLSGGNPGSAQVSFALLHKEEQHEDFGPCSLTVQVP